MATYEPVSVTADGTTSTYAVPWPFLDRAHVVVSLNGYHTLEFSWTTSSTIKFNVTPPAGTNIKITRSTTSDSPVVSFAPGTLPADALNTGFKQSLYVLQEVISNGVIGGGGESEPLTAADITNALTSTLLSGTPTGAYMLGAVSEKYDSGAGFYNPYVFFHNRNAGGKGHRNAMTVQMDIYGVGNLTDMLNPLVTLARLHSGAAGMIFGGNPYVWVDAGVDPSSQGTGLEIDTDIRASAIASKIGLTIADVATSVGHGTIYDTALMIGNQSGGVGYQNGIQFGFNGTDMKGVSSTGGLITSVGEVYHQGIDFSRTTFTAFAWKSKGLTIDPAGNIEIGSTAAVNTPFFDWHTSGNNTDYDVRMTASGGNAAPGNGALSITAAQMSVSGAINTNAGYTVAGTAVVTARNTGWSPMTGTADKTTAFATGSITLAQLASRVMSLQAALTTHGLIGT